MSLFVDCDSRQQLDVAFNRLSDGGKILMPPFHIETVGDLIFFQDTEGNIAGAMQYESVQWPE